MAPLTPEEISRLTVAERLELIGDLWDSIENKDVALAPAQAAELDRRLETFDEDIKPAIFGEEFEAKLDARKADWFDVRLTAIAETDLAETYD